MLPLSARSRLPLTILVLALHAAGCIPYGAGPARAPAGSARPLVVITSVTVLADLIRQVGGERVEVRALVPSGADPNTFQPPPRSVLEVARADLAILNGLGLERTVRGTINNANRPDLPLVFLSDGLPTLESGLVVAEPGTRGNPYLWLDPRNAVLYVERIRENLARLDPGNEGYYRANAEQFVRRVSTLEHEVEEQLRTIPPVRRKLIALHDAFPYFAARYGFELLGVVMKSPGRAPSAHEVAEISRQIRQQEVAAVFIEPQLDARLLKLAARDADVRIGTLYSDTLDQFVPSYEALLRYNARQLVNGLR